MNHFVWTEVFNCGQLSNVVLSSYIAYHKTPIHVFGFPNDLEQVVFHPLIIRCPVADTSTSVSGVLNGLSPDYLRRGFKRGHLGTARVWAHLIRKRTENCLIHVDSDIIFLGDAVDDVARALNAGAVLAGPRRMYRNNLNHRDDVRHQSDCVDTYCFGFRRDLIKSMTNRGLVRRIRGQTRLAQLKRVRVLDFFDTISFELMRDGAVAYLDSPNSGGSGLRDTESEFSRKILEVRSAVGTGCAVFNGYATSIPESYRRYALESYSIYAYYLLGVETGVPRPAPGQLEERLLSLDMSSWRLGSIS